MLLRYEQKTKTLTYFSLPKLREELIYIPDMPDKCYLVGRVGELLYFSQRTKNLHIQNPMEHGLGIQET
jgi:hypothetical protein